MQSCNLCSPDLWPVIANEPKWRLILNRNQNLLGKCFWALNRHEEQVSELTVDEWGLLHEHIRRTVSALRLMWHADHFNIAFLQNQDKHVHLHIIPRYATPRRIGERVFEDLDYPSHYAVAGPSLGLPANYLLPRDENRLTNEELEIIGNIFK